jgi:hypothetical protein
MIAVETLLAFLPQMPSCIEQGDRVYDLKGHTLGETLRHDMRGVMGGVQSDDVEQSGRPHRPAKTLFHNLIDAIGILSLGQQQAKTIEIGKQYAIDEKSRTIVDDNRNFPSARA